MEPEVVVVTAASNNNQQENVSTISPANEVAVPNSTTAAGGINTNVVGGGGGGGVPGTVNSKPKQPRKPRQPKKPVVVVVPQSQPSVPQGEQEIINEPELARAEVTEAMVVGEAPNQQEVLLEKVLEETKESAEVDVRRIPEIKTKVIERARGVLSRFGQFSGGHGLSTEEKIKFQQDRLDKHTKWYRRFR